MIVDFSVYWKKSSKISSRIVCCVVLCMSFQKTWSAPLRVFSSLVRFFLLDVMNKVWYAWNGTFARSSILNYWTYSRNSKEAGEESSLRSSRISFKKFTLIKELSLLKVKAIGNILKVLFLLWWWDKMRSKVHQNHFLLSQVICNLLYIHRYRGLSSIDRFVLITKSSSSILLSSLSSAFFLYLLSS